MCRSNWSPTAIVASRRNDGTGTNGMRDPKKLTSERSKYPPPGSNGKRSVMSNRRLAVRILFNEIGRLPAMSHAQRSLNRLRLRPTARLGMQGRGRGMWPTGGCLAGSLRPAGSTGLPSLRATPGERCRAGSLRPAGSTGLPSLRATPGERCRAGSLRPAGRRDAPAVHRPPPAASTLPPARRRLCLLFFTTRSTKFAPSAKGSAGQGPPCSTMHRWSSRR